MVRRSLFVTLCFAAFTVASPAHAWTDASVRTVHAHVSFDEQARALVAMTATVRIHSGWLEAFEIAGLDPDLRLDEDKPPSIVTEEGEKLEPHVRVTGGRVSFEFTRHEAPRHGTIFVTLVYHTDLAHRMTEALEVGDRVRVRWSLPAWQTGIDGVSLSVTAPPGAAFGTDPDVDASAEEREIASSTAVNTVLRLRRVHLPRTLAWPIAIDVPSLAMAPELRRPRFVARTTPRPRRPALLPERWQPWTLSAAIGLLAALAALTRRRVLLGMPRWAAIVAIVASASLGGFVAAGSPWVARSLLAMAALLGAGASRRLRLRPRLGAWRQAAASEIAAARRRRWQAWLGVATPFDATTVLGLALWLGLGAAWAWGITTWDADVRLSSEWVMLCLLAPLFWTGTRLHRPIDAGLALAKLDAVLRDPTHATRLVGHDASLVVHESGNGLAQEARVRIDVESALDGLLGLDLAFASDMRSGTYGSVLVCIAVARAGSDAARALDDALAGAARTTSGGGRRIAWVAGRDDTAWLAVERALEALDEGSRRAAAPTPAARLPDTRFAPNLSTLELV